MQHCQRLDQRLHLLSEEIRSMSQEKERGEQVWRERLQRCQRQLKAKVEEMSRQSQYFENFKTQLHHKLSSYRDREQSLLKRIYSLEKQLLDITVSAATGMASMKGVRITAGPEKQSEDQDRLPTMRGEGEGEEQKKEDSGTYCLPSMLPDRAKSPEGDIEVKESENKGAHVSLNDSRLQGFILSLQEDLRVLLERQEAGMTERRVLIEQLQEAQEKNQLLACKMEGMKAETDQLKLSETSLMEEVEVLREENQRLQQEATNQTPLQSSSDSESTRLSLCANWPHSSRASSNVEQTFPKNTEKIQPAADDERVHLIAVPPIDHQAAAVYKQNYKKDFSLPANLKNLPKHKAPVLLQSFFNKPKCHLQSLPFTAETFGNFKLGDVEESLSEESDALRRAFQSLGFDEDPQQQCENLNMDLQHRKEQMKAVTQENAELKSQLRKTRCEEQTTSDLHSSKEKIASVSSCTGMDSPQSSQDDPSFDLSQEDLIQALNQENRALANRIQELLAHIEHKKEEAKKEQTQLREHISKLEENGVRLEQEKQEQSCLILELTRKTEDDLNTICELQQKLTEAGEVKEESQSNELWCQNGHSVPVSAHFLQNRQEDDAESLVTSMLKENKTQFIQEIDNLTKAQLEKHCSVQNDSNGVHVGLLTAQMTQLTNLVQNLQRQEEELTGNLNDLREQQKEVSFSVQTQTEEKQQLIRTIWTLKEEKDGLFEALSNLKQEKEKLTKSVCGLREERDQVQRSTNAVKEKKEHLTGSLSDLERHKEAITELISSKRREEDKIAQTLQDLQKERDQLSQAVLYLRQQKDKLGLLIPTPEKERKETEEVLISSSEQEKQPLQINLESREEIKKVHHRFSETEENQKKPLSSVCAAGINMDAAGTEVDAAPTCETRDDRETLIQEKTDLIREMTATGAKLKNSQKELNHSHLEIKRLCSELCQSEARRREAEQMMRLTQAASKMEDTKRDNENLTAQVKELQVKVSVLLREKTEALFLKAQVEEQHRVLAAQLKAKTVALEELNSEYIELKQGQSSRDELSTALVSLRATYQDIRAKYDKLLKSKGVTDLDVVPLKAKLASLVLKCQERNGLLLQMMGAMQRCGCMDPTLAQQVEHLLSDVALQDYSMAFTPRNHIRKQDACSRFTQELISNYKIHNLQKVTCPAESSYVCSEENNDQCAQKEQQFSICVNETSTNLQTCRDSAADVAETQTKHSPDQSPPVKERASVQGSPVLTMDTNSSTVFAATELIHVGSRPEKLEFNHLDMKEKFSSDAARQKKCSQNPSSPTSSIGSGRRLSSPEKILNMHEELQRTLMSTFQLSERRGREQHPSRRLSPSTSGDQNSSSSLCLPVPLNPLKPFSKPAATNLSATLFTAVSSRSANLSPSMSTNHHLKAVFSKTCAASSSYNSPPALADSKHESTPGSCQGATISPNRTKKTPTLPNTHADSPPLTALNCNGIDPKIPPTNIPAPRPTNASGINIYSMTSKMYDAPATHAALTSHMKSPCSSPESSIKSVRRFRGATKESSPSKPEAPAEVRSVEVIKTVGQSSLLIGWERPALDELGCSNGTFVYGYRIFVNGDFHKSVMSSACTKCILENIDLSAPVLIKVQTLGSNGLRSDCVHTTYRMSEPD